MYFFLLLSRGNVDNGHCLIYCEGDNVIVTYVMMATIGIVACEEKSSMGVSHTERENLFPLFLYDFHISFLRPFLMLGKAFLHLCIFAPLSLFFEVICPSSKNIFVGEGDNGHCRLRGDGDNGCITCIVMATSGIVANFSLFY